MLVPCLWKVSQRPLPPSVSLLLPHREGAFMSDDKKKKKVDLSYEGVLKRQFQEDQWTEIAHTQLKDHLGHDILMVATHGRTQRSIRLFGLLEIQPSGVVLDGERHAVMNIIEDDPFMHDTKFYVETKYLNDPNKELRSYLIRHHSMNGLTADDLIESLVEGGYVVRNSGIQQPEQPA